MTNRLTRRGMIAGAAAIAPTLAWGQQPPAQLATPPSVITRPPRQWGRLGPPEIYPDPDILVIDRSFNQYLVGLAAIHRLWTGFQWAEGPAWSGEGQYVVFSDVKGNTQYRYIWETGEVTPFRRPSCNSNGNTLRLPGPPALRPGFLPPRGALGADGSMTVHGRSFEGKPLNSPNDMAPHPGRQHLVHRSALWRLALAKAIPTWRVAGQSRAGFMIRARQQRRRVGRRHASASCRPTPIAGIPSGTAGRGGAGQQVPGSQRHLLLARLQDALSDQHRARAGRNGSGGKGVIYAFDVQGNKVANMRMFTDCMVDGVHCGPDGMRADRAGNIWVGSNAPLGYRASRCGIRRQADRPHPPAGGLRQSLLLRAQARLPVHGREPVDLHGARQHTRRSARLSNGPGSNRSPACVSVWRRGRAAEMLHHVRPHDRLAVIVPVLLRELAQDSGTSWSRFRVASAYTSRGSGWTWNSG